MKSQHVVISTHQVVTTEQPSTSKVLHQIASPVYVTRTYYMLRGKFELQMGRHSSIIGYLHDASSFL